MEHLHLLLVEDDAKVADFVSRSLRAEGYVVDLAATGTEAVQQLDQHQYDLVLLDLMLPELSGTQVLRVGATNIVDVYVRHLRRKVDDPFPVKLIHTVRGVGYCVREDAT
jgi:DNA-binding response OmpR family regulator